MTVAEDARIADREKAVEAAREQVMSAMFYMAAEQYALAEMKGERTVTTVTSLFSDLAEATDTGDAEKLSAAVRGLLDALLEQ